MDTRIAEDGDTVLVLNSGYGPCDSKAWAIPGTVGVLHKSFGSLFRVEGFRGDLHRSEFRLLQKNHNKKEITMTKTSTAKNLNKTFAKPKPKPKPITRQEKDIIKMQKAVRAIGDAALLTLPEERTLIKSPKVELANQVIQLTIEVNELRGNLQTHKRIEIINDFNQNRMGREIRELKKSANK